MKDIFKNYKRYINESRKQTKFLTENYSFNSMTDLLKTYVDKINVTTNIPLQLPKLKKVNEY